MLSVFLALAWVGVVNAGCGYPLRLHCEADSNCQWMVDGVTGAGWCEPAPGGRRRVASDWSEVEPACQMPFDFAHEMKDELHGIVDHGMGSSVEEAISGPVEKIETKCYEIARESIAKIGIMYKEDSALMSKFADGETEDAKVAMDMFRKINGAKQCLAYLEMAKRGNAKALFWAWLNNSGTSAAREQACGDVVNSVNAKLGTEIPGTRVMEDENTIVIEDFPIGERLKAAEKKAGLASLLSKAVVGSSAVAGSFMAGVCKSWQHMQG